MPAPPQFAKKGGDSPSDMKNPSGGAKSHLDALESLAKTPRARAALNTLRSELVGGDSGPPKSGKPSSAGAKSEALARFNK